MQVDKILHVHLAVVVEVEDGFVDIHIPAVEVPLEEDEVFHIGLTVTVGIAGEGGVFEQLIVETIVLGVLLAGSAFAAVYFEAVILDPIPTIKIIKIVTKCMIADASNTFRNSYAC